MNIAFCYENLFPNRGGCETYIASLAHRFVAMIDHVKHRLPERVSYITSPGNGEGGNWRRKVGLPRGGPSAVITTKAVLRFGRSESAGVNNDGEAYLSTNHPGVSIEDIIANTGWRLRVAENVRETEPPSAAELKAIREYDKEGFWTS